MNDVGRFKFRGFRSGTIYGFSEFRDMILANVVYHFRIRFKIMVAYNIAHAFGLFPVNLRKLPQE